MTIRISCLQLLIKLTQYVNKLIQQLKPTIQKTIWSDSWLGLSSFHVTHCPRCDQELQLSKLMRELYGGWVVYFRVFITCTSLINILFWFRMLEKLNLRVYIRVYHLVKGLNKWDWPTWSLTCPHRSGSFSRVIFSTRKIHVKVGHSNVWKSMTKWDSLISDAL